MWSSIFKVVFFSSLASADNCLPKAGDHLSSYVAMERAEVFDIGSVALVCDYLKQSVDRPPIPALDMLERQELNKFAFFLQNLSPTVRAGFQRKLDLLAQISDVDARLRAAYVFAGEFSSGLELGPLRKMSASAHLPTIYDQRNAFIFYALGRVRQKSSDFKVALLTSHPFEKESRSWVRVTRGSGLEASTFDLDIAISGVKYLPLPAQGDRSGTTESKVNNCQQILSCLADRTWQEQAQR